MANPREEIKKHIEDIRIALYQLKKIIKREVPDAPPSLNAALLESNKILGIANKKIITLDNTGELLTLIKNTIFMLRQLKIVMQSSYSLAIHHETSKADIKSLKVDKRESSKLIKFMLREIALAYKANSQSFKEE